ncbi:hypothetical protein BP00DRAFT_429969 [Aspergillus indologenus CBS 114.80]|uniref:RRM domain-containing protein n=1 Tax=Aspergillus indologenus CBS 114.80 TaxID=1450541 RepID=A0A2V5HYV7_9EURO|nr:hypothetical protein BP00DRAFT_429969 [Aspergillus indologenus CBS 114.80]
MLYITPCETVAEAEHVLRQFSRRHGFGVSRLRSKRKANGELAYITFICDRGGPGR